eukprot:973143_1
MVSQIGTYSVFADDATATEFIPYITRLTYDPLICNDQSKLCDEDDDAIQQAMDVAGIVDNPFVFFKEMKQVLQNIKHKFSSQNQQFNSNQNVIDQFIVFNFKQWFDYNNIFIQKKKKKH